MGLVSLTVVVAISAWYIRNQVHIKKIDARYVDVHAMYSHGRFNDAFQIMSPAYRSTHTVDAFIDEFRTLEDRDLFKLEPGHSVRIGFHRAWLYPRRVEWLTLWSGPDFEWELIDGEWYLTGQQKYYTD